MIKQRLDHVLVAQGKAESRTKAQDLIEKGLVSLEGKILTKSAQKVSLQAPLSLAEQEMYVSRAAGKLKAGLEHFPFPVKDGIFLDIGASTGGFTEVLLEAGASEVYAVDVGQDQLHARIKNDSRVRNWEKVNARHLKAEDFPVSSFKAQGLVCDASFISLRKVLETALFFVETGGWAIVLVKPQFELSPQELGKSAIVKDPDKHHYVCEQVKNWFKEQGWGVKFIIPSPVVGRHGNQEFLLGALKEEDDKI